MKIISNLRNCMLAAVVGIGFATASTHAHATCSGGYSLYGWYGMLAAGPVSTGGLGRYQSGAVYFNGNCGLSAYNVNGGINGATTNSSLSGTYTTNADHTISISMIRPGEIAAETYIVGVQRSAFGTAVGIEMDGSAVATIQLVPQFQPFGGYHLSSLAGTFSAVCTGQPGNYSDLNYVTFDGRGNISGVDPFNVNGNIGNAPYIGTYTVASDGTVSGALLGDYSEFSFTGVIDAAAQELDYTYNLAGAGGVVSCVGKK